MLRAFVFFTLFSLLLAIQGCDIKGANDPYSYAPHSPDSIWQPPKKAQKRLPNLEDLSKEGEDYSQVDIN